MKGSGPAKKNETEIKVKIWQESEGRNERLGFRTKRTRQLRVEMWKCENVKVSSGKKLSRLCNI